ncbi:BZ3500_MvSof-1268-A1-R1_Chr2-2g05177 [Microbotryum saponariae]|uniref:BZ3500_MvSof-1268-A1-R1_Chr2-2g05177 protein n=1 Tax=Microbotryum saponariae TaxID=289078 RepID=A0A2X0KNR4_9BASI|nr:BZ3500_MvSof-1268-A1-R1_Chr2-2g05177 [Microbotryum saponariae]SDA01004.1 BZ3501_MvSof-1269-A2-R1_Chr2-2g04851 [Microbotryum saponariae]
MSLPTRHRVKSIALMGSLWLGTTTLAATPQIPFQAFPGRPASMPLQEPGSGSASTDRPYRELPWGDVNIISTTDTHGWLLGHQNREPNYSGDWGDLYSFTQRLRHQARARGVDLLLVDSGDRVDGNGLVDAEPIEHAKGYTAMQYFQNMPYDVITTGNHELYRYPVARSVLENLVQHYGERFVASNVDIRVTDESSEKLVPYGRRFRKFRTEMGRNVTAFGPLFDFRAHAAGIRVQAPREMIKEPWFLEAVREKPSFFLLVGHMSIRSELDSQWSLIVRAIRAVHSRTPILIFGGHHHIRDCVMEDERSMSIAAGRYMETIGWMSVSGIDANNTLTFERRFLDQNRATVSTRCDLYRALRLLLTRPRALLRPSQYEFHAGEKFDTAMGQAITKNLSEVAKGFNLTHRYGVAPQSYYLSRHPHNSQQSILNLLTTRVLPLLVTRPDRPNPSWVVLNSGSVRFDVFKGPFTRNDQWIILPFTNSFLFVPGVKRSVAQKMLAYLNVVGEHKLTSSSASVSVRSTEDNYVEDRWAQERESLHLEHLHRRALLEASNLSASIPPSEYDDASSLSLGYVTQDACGGLGDDTLHRPVPSVWQPIFVATEFPPSAAADLIDVVFFDFIQPDILGALNTLQNEREYASSDVKLFVEDLTANTLMQEYAKREWN